MQINITTWREFYSSERLPHLKQSSPELTFVWIVYLIVYSRANIFSRRILIMAIFSIGSRRAGF